MTGNDLLVRSSGTERESSDNSTRGFGMTSTVAKLSMLRAPSGAGGSLAWIAVFLVLACSLAAPALAQNAPPPMVPGPMAAEAVRESPLSVIYLKDKDGNLVRAPAGMTFEDFERLHRLDQNLAQPEAVPRQTIQLVAGTGKLQGAWAELDLTVTVGVVDAEWVRVPLRLAGSVLREPPKVENAADFFLKVESDGSLAAWLKADPKRPAKIKLAVNAPVAASGTERRLALAAPRAQLDLKLTIPAARIQAEATGATLDRIDHAGQLSILVLVGRGGDFEVVWRDQSIEGARALSATANILVTFESPQRATFDARLRLTPGPGQALDKFRLRLPPNVELAADAPGFAWTTVGGSKTQVEITLAKPGFGPVDLRLTGRMNATNDKNVELAGFEVVGATQTGHLAVIVEGDLSLRFQEGKHVARVDELPEVLKLPSVRAGFRYFRGDFSLPVSVLPKRMHLAVEPTYTLTVEPDAVRLEGSLKCQVRGAKCYDLDVTLAGWTVEAIGPDTLVDSENALLDETAPLHIPLLKGTSGEFEVKIKARRAVERGMARLSILLPAAAGTVVHPPVIVVSSADNVRLAPLPAEMPGLTLDASPVSPAPGGGQAFVYRGKPDGGAAVFVADRTLQGRTVQVAIKGDAVLAKDSVTIEERYGYSIQNEPLGAIRFLVPTIAAQPGVLSIKLDDQPVVPEFDLAGTMSDEGGERIMASVTLREPQQGPLTIVLTYRLPLAVESNQPAAAQRVPLVSPLDGEVSSRSLRFSGEGAERVVAEGGWLRRASSAAAGGQEFSIEGAAEEIAFEITPVATRRGAGPRVERLWLQTLVTATTRQDRAVFRLAGPQRSVRVALPEGVRPEEVDVIVDGVRPTAVTPQSNGVLDIEWAGTTPDRGHCVELWYPYDAARTPLTALAAQPPQIEGAPWVPQLYWQVVTPPHEVSLNTPVGLLPEFDWHWRGLGWSPASRLDQLALEDWAGASHQTAVPEGMNQYLFSGFGASDGELRLGDRRMWFVLGAGAVLLLGLLLVYVPVLRHPGLVAVAAAVVIGIWMYDPTLALVAAQGMAAGLILAALSFALDAWLVRPRTEQTSQASHDSRQREPRADSRARELRTTEAVPSISRDSSRTPSLHPAAGPLPPATAAAGSSIVPAAGSTTATLAAPPLVQDGP